MPKRPEANHSAQVTCRRGGGLAAGSFSVALAALLAGSAIARTGLAAQSSRPVQRMEVWGFTAPWDTASAAAVREHGSGLDAVVTGWIGLDSTTARPIQPVLYPDTLRPRRGTLRRMAIVTSWHGDRFHARTIRTLAADRALLSQTAGHIARHSAAMRYSGLVLDFETLDARDVSALLTVVRAIADSAHARGIRMVAVAVPATDSAAYPARPLLGVADVLLPMLYDQHWPGSAPGPTAEPAWVHAALAARVAEAGGPARIVAALPAYGYRWWTGSRARRADAVSFREARRIAAAARVPLARDAATQTLRATRAGEWEMWVTDAALLRTLVREARALGVRRFALWRMGQEDEAVWRSVFD